MVKPITRTLTAALTCVDGNELDDRLKPRTPAADIDLVERGDSSWLRQRLSHLVGRDSLTGASADESRQLELCRYMWWARHVMVGVAAAVGLADGATSRPEMLAAIMFGVQVVNHVWSVVSPGRAGLIAVLDAGAFLAMSALGLAPLLVLLVGVAMLGWAATFRPVPATATGSAVLTATTLMIERSNGPSVGAVLISFYLLAVIFLIRTVRLNIGARRSAERERLISERVDAVLWEPLPGADAIKVSPSAERILGYPTGVWATPGFWRQVIHPDDVSEPSAGGTSGSVARVRHADGSWRWVENRMSAVQDRHGRDAFLVGVLVDRTEQVEAEREALAFGHLVALSPIGQILLTCAAGPPMIEALNPACRSALGLAEETAGSSWAEHAEGLACGPAVSELLDMVVDSGAGSIEFTGADGRVYQADGHRVGDHLCKIDFIDVTERVDSGRRLHDLARQDELTGLPNRRHFLERLQDLILDRPDDPTALLVLDLDDFKEINDSLGHATGDDLLRSVGDRIRGRLRSGEVAARLGGDEFAVILPGVGPSAAAARGKAIGDAISAPIEVGDLRLRVRASMGIAVFPFDATDLAELIRRADIAMYQAKSQGADPHHYDSATDRFSTERVTLAADLDTAISSSQLTLHHQPLVALATGFIAGTEALVRWQHPTLGTVAPGRFIELAEVSGQMKHLTRWVVRQALSELRHLGDLARDLHVSVNLSVRNLYETDFVAWLTRTLAELDLPGDRLVVEITEGTVMVDYPAAIKMIETIRELGVRTWIDDFGTGHSSLARLTHLPVDGVKIDRAFVDRASRSAKDREVLRGLIGLIKSVDLRSIAEGVEHADCLDLLRDLGCDLAQGFHLSPPVPVSTLSALLAGPAAAGARSAPVPVGGRSLVPRPATAPDDSPLSLWHP